MKNLFGLVLAVALAAGAAILVTPHPSAATPILADYSGATTVLLLLLVLESQSKSASAPIRKPL